MNPDRLKSFGALLQRIIAGENLSRHEAYLCFLQLMRDEQPDLHQGALLAALACKGESSDEISGAWQAIQEADTATAILPHDLPLIENSGSGMDRLKTFNVSSAAAIVAASCGAALARHGARALTSFCGTVDILEAVGLDVDCPVELVTRSIASVGIGLFNGMSRHIHPAGLGRILGQIRFGSVLNIAASLANPARPRLAVRGIYSPDLLPLVAEVMRQIGFHHALIVCGQDAASGSFMDELSVCGSTQVCEMLPGQPDRYWPVDPEETGVARHPFESIAATGDLARERQRFVRTLAGTGPQACIDFTCLNAAAILYVGGISPSLREGVIRSRHAIASGDAFQKLKQWVMAQNTNPAQGLATLHAAMQG